MTNDEERALEAQLEIQLKEQRESLTAIEEALAVDPSDPELLAVHGELGEAIRDAEGLLQLKRAGLLQEADSVLQGFDNNSEEVKAETLDPFDDVEPEPSEGQSFFVGSKCRFRHRDGRWYNGRIISVEGSEAVKVSFLTPTTENMLMCKFFLQQRCRFGSRCRYSHGIVIPICSLKNYVNTEWDKSMVGSTIWAVFENSGIWKKAELQLWDEQHKLGHVIFCDDGSSATLGVDSMMLPDYGQETDIQESDTSCSFESESIGSDEEDTPLGLGFVESTALQRGIQTETTIFAKWENHTRGIASKMMASMGYRQGMGLGASGQGQVNPVPVRVLKPKQSLDHALEAMGKEENGEESHTKKRRRDGKRKRVKKMADATRAAKEAAEEKLRPDVFSLINSRLAMHHQAVNGGSTTKNEIKEQKNVDRRSMLAYENEIKSLGLQIERLEQMCERNRKDKVIYEAAKRKLTETQKALADVEVAHACASSAVKNREKEKKWLKF